MSKKTKQPSSDPTQHAESKWEAFAKQEAEGLAGQEGDEDESEGLVTPGGIDFPERSELEGQLTAAEKEALEYKDQLMRARAEMENLRRRVERDIANARKFGSEKLLVDLLPVVDSLVRGLEAPETENPQEKAMRQGLELTLGILEKTLEKHGIVEISPNQGEDFNPELHEAMSMQPAGEAKSNTVLQVVQKGYQLNGRVLRAAMVIVVQ